MNNMKNSNLSNLQKEARERKKQLDNIAKNLANNVFAEIIKQYTQTYSEKEKAYMHRRIGKNLKTNAIAKLVCCDQCIDHHGKLNGSLSEPCCTKCKECMYC